MNDKPLPDRFSAYHDGEIAGAEADAIRLEIESSTDAQGEMADCRQLSRLLNALPQERLGSEFPAAVLQGVERSMLLPAAEELALARPRAVTRGRWLATLAAFAASAAVLFVAVKLLDRGTQESASTIASRSPEATGSGSSSGHAGIDVASASREAAPVSIAAQPKAAAPPGGPDVAKSDVASRAKEFSGGGGGGFGGGGEAQPYITNTIAPKSVPVNTDDFDATDGPSPPLEFTRNLQDAEVGEVVEAIARSGERIAVVRLTVVDRIAGLEEFQVLLSRNSITVAGEAEPSKPALKENKQDVAQKNEAVAEGERKNHKRTEEVQALVPGDTGEQMYCVLVNADTNQLSAALSQLELGKQFKELRVEDPPLAVAQLDSYAYQASEKKSAESVPTQVDVNVFKSLLRGAQQTEAMKADADAKGSEPELATDESIAKHQKASDKEVADAKQSQHSATLAQSQQLPVKIPSRLLSRADVARESRQGSQARDDAPRQQRMLKTQRKIAGQLKDAAPARGPADTPTQSQVFDQKQAPRPVRVLVVLEERTRHDSDDAPGKPHAEEPQNF